MKMKQFIPMRRPRNTKVSKLIQLSACWLFLLLATTGVSYAQQDVKNKTQPEPCLILAYDPRMGDSVPVFNRFFHKLYNRIGRCIKSVPMTSRRKEAQLVSGEIDGDWMRVEGFQEYAGDAVIELPQPIFTMPAMFVWPETTTFSGNPDTLKTVRRIGYGAGFRWIEWNLGKLGVKGVPLPTEDTILDLFERGRIDLYITGAVNAAGLQNQASKEGITVNIAPWTDVKFYHLLHRDHQALVPQLNETLTLMIKNGDADEINTLEGITVARPEAP